MILEKIKKVWLGNQSDYIQPLPHQYVPVCGHRRNRPVYAARADKGDLCGSARQVKRETQTGNPHPVRWHRFYPFGRACTKGNGVTEGPPSLENTWFSAFFQTTVLRSPAQKRGQSVGVMELGPYTGTEPFARSARVMEAK